VSLMADEDERRSLTDALVEGRAAPSAVSRIAGYLDNQYLCQRRPFRTSGCCPHRYAVGECAIVFGCVLPAPRVGQAIRRDDSDLQRPVRNAVPRLRPVAPWVSGLIADATGSEEERKWLYNFLHLERLNWFPRFFDNDVTSQAEGPINPVDTCGGSLNFHVADGHRLLARRGPTGGRTVVSGAAESRYDGGAGCSCSRRRRRTRAAARGGLPRESCRNWSRPSRSILTCWWRRFWPDPRIRLRWWKRTDGSSRTLT
jgi:hypothetical protein